MHGLFRQDNFGKDLPKRKDETGAEYKKDFKSFKRFVKRVLTDYNFATEVAIKYEKALLSFCDDDIWAAASFNLGGFTGLKAYKRRDYDFRIGNNATIWAYVKKVVAYSNPNAPKPKQRDILDYKPSVKTPAPSERSEQKEA